MKLCHISMILTFTQMFCEILCFTGNTHSLFLFTNTEYQPPSYSLDSQPDFSRLFWHTEWHQCSDLSPTTHSYCTKHPFLSLTPPQHLTHDWWKILNISKHGLMKPWSSQDDNYTLVYSHENITTLKYDLEPQIIL